MALTRRGARTVLCGLLLSPSFALAVRAQDAPLPAANTAPEQAAPVEAARPTPIPEPPPVPKPEMQAVLDKLAAQGGRPIETLSPEEARRQPTPADAVKALLAERGESTEPEPVGKVEDRRIDGAAGPVPARIYWPAREAGAEPRPMIHYLHGGGWVLADLDTYDASARALANATEAIVVATHYRQAPEHPFPAAHDDSFAAYRWVLANAESLGGDPRKVAVAGESAGGNMAAAITLMARNAHVPMPVHQVLIYPVAQPGVETPSYRENADAKPLNGRMMRWFLAQYLRSPDDGRNPLLALLEEDQLHGLPSTTVITAEIDPLRSEGMLLADRLEKAHVNVHYENYRGVTHEFFGMGAVLPDAKQAVAQVAADLRGSFGQPRTASVSGGNAPEATAWQRD